MKLLLFILFELSGMAIYPQVVAGKIIDADSKSPIEYVNIGIIGAGIGTVCNEVGKFSIELPAEHGKDTLRISIVGYYPVNYLVEDFKRACNANPDGLIIELSKKTIVLNEVMVSTHEIKEKEVGTKGRLGSVEFISNKDLKLGAEIGTVIKLKERPALIKVVNFVFNLNNYTDSIIFRVNIYSMNGKLPGENILTEPIYVFTNIKKGLLTANLEEYRIYVEDDFVVSLEWIQEKGEKKIGFGMGMKGQSFMRTASESGWDEFPLGFAFGIFATLSYIK